MTDDFPGRVKVVSLCCLPVQTPDSLSDSWWECGGGQNVFGRWLLAREWLCMKLSTVGGISPTRETGWASHVLDAFAPL